MTCLSPAAHMTFGGSEEPACYVEIKNIGRFQPALTKKMSAELSDVLSKELGVGTDRIYIEFADAEAHMWGHAGETFA